MIIADMNILIFLGQKDELNSYEETLYNQVCVTLQALSRLNELKIREDIEDVNKDKGGIESQDTKTKEH